MALLRLVAHFDEDGSRNMTAASAVGDSNPLNDVLVEVKAETGGWGLSYYKLLM